MLLEITERPSCPDIDYAWMMLKAIYGELSSDALQKKSQMFWGRISRLVRQAHEAQGSLENVFCPPPVSHQASVSQVPYMTVANMNPTESLQNVLVPNETYLQSPVTSLPHSKSMLEGMSPGHGNIAQQPVGNMDFRDLPREQQNLPLMYHLTGPQVNPAGSNYDLPRSNGLGDSCHL